MHSDIQSDVPSTLSQILDAFEYAHLVCDENFMIISEGRYMDCPVWAVWVDHRTTAKGIPWIWLNEEELASIQIVDPTVKGTIVLVEEVRGKLKVEIVDEDYWFDEVTLKD